MDLKTLTVPALLAATLAAIIIATIAQNSDPTPSDALTAACENELMDRLISPSSYSRVSISSYEPRAATWEMYQRLDDEHARNWFSYLSNGDEAEQNLARELRGIYDRMSDPTEWSALLTYDASNEFGVAVRKRSICSIITDGQFTAQSISHTRTRVDGMSGPDWSLARLRN